MKVFNLDVHVQIFKVTIKPNVETKVEEITNIFNLTFRDILFNWCNNYMWDYPNYKFVDLQQTFYKCYYTMCIMMNKCNYS